MKRSKVSSLIAVVLVFALFFSQLPAQAANAAVMVPEDEKTLTGAEPVEGLFESSEQVHWYKIDPTDSEVEDFTHIRINLQSEQELNITVYSSLENAVDNLAFERYMNYSYANEPAVIDFPVAWVGPYYIKVEFLGGEYVEEAPELELDTSYTIGYEGVTLPPSEQALGEECPVELSTEQREHGKNILADLRTVREDVLAKSDNGKELSAMYYKAAPFISTKMIFSKSLRDNVYNDLVQLKSLFADIAAKGSSSSYKVTKEDQKAINNLYAAAKDSVPEFLKQQIEKTGKSIDISNLTNQTVSSILAKGGYGAPKASNENRVIVKLKDGEKLSSIQSKTKTYGVQSVEPMEESEAIFPNMFVMEVEGSSDFSATAKSLKAATNQLAKLPEVEFVEPVQQYQAFSDDSQYPYQWSLENKGDNHGTADADIQYTELKDLIKDKKLDDTVIAVLDTGVDHTLADLNGNVDVEAGYNFIGRNTDAMDDHGHGTHVSGIIAAAANNNYSMTGINEHATILPVKVLDSAGGGDTEQIAYGIKYAVDNGAEVINLSLGGPYSRVLEVAMKYAHDHNVTVVAASGNDGFEEVSYPGSSKYAIAVGSTNRLDIVADYSNYGKGLDLVAPGSDIPSLMPDGNVTYMSGTSMATPHVAAVAGLLLSHNKNLKPAQIESILTKTAYDVAFDEQDNPYDDYNEDFPEEEYPYPVEELAPGYDQVSGWGRLDAFSAVSYLDQKGALLERISGTDRYETAVNVSKEGWDKSDTIVLATGRNYPDALSATPLASKHNAPLLLTSSSSLPKAVKDEIKRLKAKKVVVIGGNSVISTNVEKEIKALGITDISRISGKDRYETSVNIAKQLGASDKVVVATGESFADALSIAPVAASLDMPILLTKKSSAPASVIQYVKSAKFKQSFVIGGSSVITNQTAKNFPNNKRLSGATRYETNSSIINYFAKDLNMETPFLATGSNYPDALSGSALAAAEGNPMVLTHPKTAQKTTKDVIAKYGDKAQSYYIIGGKNALPDASVEALFQ
ncbi:peptidase S8 [Jeotgalibacillus sp. S-D1]|uniref:cell wall-binding repeat-containing protein n=1 Tax=Jeotgalibacillus sp. S-D1 TaxID=2552189 RepID=UPI0010598D63|nr:cell wall-binding repeat-containing protein [Jeotgalibacillus sp. S-D1]TDL31326.1 peptidase S8 [Jeotgalibacillus sp. S-D1]